MIAKTANRRVHHLNWFDVLLYAFFLALAVCFVYPIWFCVVCAFTSGPEIKRAIPLFLPRDICIDAFMIIFKDKGVVRYFVNTIIYSVGGTIISLLLTSMIAFPFTVRTFRGKKFLNLYMVITMFVSGGLLPTYYLISYLGMRDTIWVMLLPGAVSAYNAVIFRTFFRSIPDALFESAYIDGASYYRVLFTITIPLSKALIATFALFGLVGRWNDWFSAYLYLTTDNMKPISLYLRSLLCVNLYASDHMESMYGVFKNATEQNVKCAAVLISTIPIMCVYPFIQKYFTKGIMIGAVKE